jgi:hypothetical protein
VFCVAPDNPELACRAGTNVPVGGYVPDLDDAIDLASCDQVMCALRRRGDLRCWSTCTVDDPIQLAPISNVAELSGGRHFSARMRDGSVHSLLGDRWARVEGIVAERLYGGAFATCVRTRGELSCWQELGQGDPFGLRRLDTPGGYELAAVGDGHVCFAHDERIHCIGRH